MSGADPHFAGVSGKTPVPAGTGHPGVPVAPGRRSLAGTAHDRPGWQPGTGTGKRGLCPGSGPSGGAAGLCACVRKRPWGRTAPGQQACRDRGGSYISVVADELEKWEPRPNCLYLSEDGFGEHFSAQRALSRNRIIHALGDGTLVAQCRLEMGGTWSGTTQNLRRGWSPVTCFEDGSAAMEAYTPWGRGRFPVGPFRPGGPVPPGTHAF